MLVWIEFVICTSMIFFSGSGLSRYGDVIAEKTRAGRTWIGVVLMASVTSLPELVTGISSVAVYRVPNIAAGDVLGSCMVNLLILAVLDIGKRREPISSVAQQGHVLSAAFGILLLGSADVSILTADSIPALGWVGLNSVVFLLLYFVAMRVVFRYEKRRIAAYVTEIREEDHYTHISKSVAYFRFSLCALLVAAAGAYLPYVAEQLSDVTGLGRTFVGTTFVALSTSLPEIAVTQAALKVGAVDLAVGNMLGSNMFNVAILAVDDLFYFRGPLLMHTSQSQAVTASGAMAMTALMIVALMYRSKKKFFFTSWESLGMFLVYSISQVLLYFQH
jgi:cation:H+ antiporter